MRRIGATLLAVAAWAGVTSAAAASPIPEKPASREIPDFLGSPATPQPISYVDAPTPPRHPFMAPNDRSNLHDDPYQTDTTNGPGPLGRGMERISYSNLGDCGSITFDSRGRIVTVCVGVARPVLKLLDAGSLTELASMDLPPRQGVPANLFQDFAGGGYFYLDQHDRAVIPTTTRHILVVAETGAPGFAVQRDYDVSGKLASDDKIISALPDWSGRIWFASTQGVVGTVNPDSGAVRTLATHEPIGNSHAVDETGGVYVVTDGALYRFDGGPSGEPRVTWRAPYRNDGTLKPGQTQHGSGTTPTLMGRDYVAITDNADPIDIVVFRRTRRVTGTRLVCTQPVFSKGASSTDNSLIGTADSMVVENNHGYTGPAATMGGATQPGVERVDIDRDGRGCHRAWRSSERSPSVVPKLSLENGLVYVYTKDPDPAMDDPFYLTALDFRTGRTMWKRRAGNGFGFNNNYAPVTLGPDGSAYIGVLGGMVALRDRPAPARVKRPRGPSGLRSPRLLLGVYGLHRRHVPRRTCAPASVRALIAGRDKRNVRRVVFTYGPRVGPLRIRSAGRSPFEVRLRASALHSGRTYAIRAAVTLRDGRRVRLSRRFRAC